MDKWLIQFCLIMFIPLLCTIYLLNWCTVKVKTWMGKRKALNKLAIEYMQKLQTREELLMHFDWGANNGEKKIGLAKEITNMDKELQSMYRDYINIKSGAHK